jgi:hypothetical protein
MLRTLALSLLLTSTSAVAESPLEVTEVQPAGASFFKWDSYGQTFLAESTVLSAASLLADPSAYVGQTVTVEGRIADVCTKMGCWLVLAEGDKSIRVLTRAHKFFVAKDSKGKTCRIQGVVQAKEIKAEEVAHFESESSEDAVIPEKKVQGTQTYELIASAVSIERTGN